MTRALSMDTLKIASIWPIVRTTRRYLSRYCVHIPVRVTSSTCCPGLSLEADLADAAQEEALRRVMALRNLCLLLLSKRSVRLFLVNWVS
jgi:hypothetical protein